MAALVICPGKPSTGGEDPENVCWKGEHSSTGKGTFIVTVTVLGDNQCLLCVKGTFRYVHRDSTG